MQSFKRVVLLGISVSCIAGSGYAQDSTPSNPINAAGLVHSLNQSGNTQAATDILRQRVASSDASADDYLILAASLRNTQMYNEAVSTLQKAQQKFPENTEILYQLGLAYIANKQPESAVNTLDMLTAMEPEHIMAYNAKAVAYDKAGNHFAAQELYNIALKHDPNAVSTLNNLAMSLILDNRPIEAIDILEPLLGRTNNNPKVRHNLALAYGITGKSQQAKELASQDLTEEQMQENLKFYQHYSALQKEYAPVALFSEDDQMLYDPTPTPPPAEHKIDPEANAPADLPTSKPAVDTQHMGSLAPAAGTQDAPTQNTEEDDPPFGKNAVYSYPTHKQR